MKIIKKLAKVIGIARKDFDSDPENAITKVIAEIMEYCDENDISFKACVTEAKKIAILDEDEDEYEDEEE